MRHILIALVLCLTACFGKPLDRLGKKTAGATPLAGVAAITSENGGAVTGAGASVYFGPGTLAIDTSVTVEEGLPLASAATAVELGVVDAFGASATPVAVSSSTPTDATAPFTISLPLPPAASLQGNPYDLVVILFKYFIAAENRYEMGIWTRDKFAIEGNQAKVPTLYFGVYQAVFSKALITTSITVASATPIVTKAQDVAAAPITWSAVDRVSSLGLRAKLRATVTGLPGIAACVLIVDRDKAEPWDYVSPKLLTPEHEFSVTVAGGYAGRFECSGIDGRLSPASDWSANMALSGSALPLFTSISPLIVPPTAGSMLTINGTGFKAGAVVNIGSAACGPTTLVGTTKLTCVLPALAANATKYDVKVTIDGLVLEKKKILTVQVPGQMTKISGALDFGNQVIGGTVTGAFVFKNVGKTAVSDLSITVLAGVFSVTASTCENVTVQVNATCNVVVTFTPTAASAVSHDLTLAYDDGFGATVTFDYTLSGTGLLPALLEFDVRSPYDFGVIKNLLSRTRTVTVTNTGDLDATGVVEATLTQPFEKMSSNCPPSIAPAQSCTIALKFTGQATDSPSTAAFSLTYASGLTPSATTSLALNGQSSTVLEATSLAVGSAQTCVRLTSDVVKCWGKNDSGQLGQDGSTSIGGFGTVLTGGNAVTLLPVKAKRVFGSADASHFCAISDLDQLYCWGVGTEGRTGHGNDVIWGNGTDPMASLPATSLGTGYWAKDVAIGSNFTCVILGHTDATKNGNVKCFGDNTFGQLGYNDFTPRGGAAAQMGDNLAALNFSGNIETALAITAGANHACALLTDFSVECWGNNDSKQLGLGVDAAMVEQPGLVTSGEAASVITAGTQHTCVLDNLGVRCWGSDTYGQLGNGSGSTGDVGGTVQPLSLTPLTLSGTATSIVAGRHSTCARLNSNTIECWGSNDNGVLGPDPVTTAYNDSIAAELLETTINGIEQYAFSPTLLGIGNHTCVKLNDSARSLRCFGDNSFGQTGLGLSASAINEATPLLDFDDTATLVDYQ